MSARKAERAVAHRAWHWARTLGPGLITGAADDDPSGISTYSIAGASTGYTMLWTALVTAPMMAVVNGVCARVGIVTGGGLMRAISSTLPRPFAFILLLAVAFANTFNIGADLAGMGASAMMLAPWIHETFWILLFAAIMILVEVFFSYRAFARIVKWLCLVLLAYVVTAFVVRPPWQLIAARTFVPRIEWNAGWLTTLMGVLGTTITPYLFFWQSAMETEERRDRRLAVSSAEIDDLHEDVNTGAIYSNVITFFIIVTAAAALRAHGITSITTAQDAALALRPLAGNVAYALFAVGIVGTGLLAVPVLAGSSAYMVSEFYNLSEGLHEKPRRARTFYGIIIAGLIAGAAMVLLRVDPIRALFWSAVLNGLAVVPLLYAIIRIAGNRDLLGGWTASRSAFLWLWLTFGLMTLAAVSMFVSWIG
jgi:NRAMP (natural resistance-associated macrophage protein)-like metal ion transporter